MRKNNEVPSKDVLCDCGESLVNKDKTTSNWTVYDSVCSSCGKRSERAQGEIRRIIIGAMVMILLVTVMKQPPVRDIGFGVCPAFAHFHDSWMMLSEEERYVWSTKYPEPNGAGTRPVMDGLCHTDDMDEPILGNNNELDTLQRRVLPVPK